MGKPSIIGRVKLLPGETVDQAVIAASEFNATLFREIEFGEDPNFIHLEWKDGDDCYLWRKFRRHMTGKTSGQKRSHGPGKPPEQMELF